MAEDPPPFSKLRRVATGSEPPPLREERIAYRLALELAQRLETVVEGADGVERAYLRGTLDKRSSTIAQLVDEALATAEMVRRRGLLENARIFTTECEAILGVLAQRGSVEDTALMTALESCRELRAHLATLTVPPK